MEKESIEINDICYKCKEKIDFIRDLFCLLGTYDGDKTVREDYFHMKCWRDHFEEQTRKKAENIVNAMQEKMMPIAKQMTDKLKQAIGQGDAEAGQVIQI